MDQKIIRRWLHAERGTTMVANMDDLVVASLLETERNEYVPIAPRGEVCPCPGWKRAIDVIGASAALVILLPLMLCVAALIKCVSRGPVLFRQQRYGLGGKPFLLWKFRTIKTTGAPALHHSHVTDLMANDWPLRKLDGELAVIWGGSVLRRFGLDELPQMINVLKGEMSLVGPRPDVLPRDCYQAWQRDRFNVLPGITGMWQVSGKNHTTFSTMIRLDLAYIHQRSLWLDISILLKTIPALLWS